MTWTLIIDTRPPNLNDHLVNRSGGHSAAFKRAYAATAGRYRRVRDQWTLLIRNQMQWASCPNATGARRVVYTRIMGTREREWEFDNLVGGGKPVFDAMKRAGLIVDDSVKLCMREYAQERGAKSGLRLEVSDV